MGKPLIYSPVEKEGRCSKQELQAWKRLEGDRRCSSGCCYWEHKHRRRKSLAECDLSLGPLTGWGRLCSLFSPSLPSSFSPSPLQASLPPSQSLCSHTVTHALICIVSHTCTHTHKVMPPPTVALTYMHSRAAANTVWHVLPLPSTSPMALLRDPRIHTEAHRGSHRLTISLSLSYTNTQQLSLNCSGSLVFIPFPLPGIPSCLSPWERNLRNQAWLGPCSLSCASGPCQLICLLESRETVISEREKEVSEASPAVRCHAVILCTPGLSRQGQVK